MYLILHYHYAEYDALEKLKYNPWRSSSVVEVLDTQRLFGFRSSKSFLFIELIVCSSASRFSDLAAIIEDLHNGAGPNSPPLALHNTDADSFYTMKIFIDIVCRSAGVDRSRAAPHSFYDDAILLSIDFEYLRGKECSAGEHVHRYFSTL